MKLNLRFMEWLKVSKTSLNVSHSKLSEQQDSNSVCITQIISNGIDKLACLSSNQVVNVYEQEKKQMSHVAIIDNLHEKKVNELGFFKQTSNANMIFTCGDDGQLKCWDLRLASLESRTKPVVCISCSEEDREFLCADINSEDCLFAIGTNKTVDDALVYIFDIRACKKYMYRFCESHSEDITQTKFEPTRPKKFASASLDGLVCLYDLEQQQEPINRDTIPKAATSGSNSDSEDVDSDPDLMEQVLNAQDPIQKLGYLNSVGLDKNTAADKIYAITLTNGLYVWDLTSHDLTYKKETREKNLSIVAEDYPTQEEIDGESSFLDVFYYMPFDKVSSEKQTNLCLTTLTADQRGNIKIDQDNKTLFDSSLLNSDGIWNRAHKGIIRSSVWNSNNSSYYTVGEDGYIIKWQLESVKVDTQNGIEADTKKRKLDKKFYKKETDQPKSDSSDHEREERNKKCKKENKRNKSKKKMKMKIINK
jgi:WD40 repeat protein